MSSAQRRRRSVLSLGDVSTGFEIALQHERICRLDALVVIVFALDDLEAVMLIEVDSSFVIDLHVKVDVVEALLVALAQPYHVIEHDRTWKENRAISTTL